MPWGALAALFIVGACSRGAQSVGGGAIPDAGSHGGVVVPKLGAACTDFEQASDCPASNLCLGYCTHGCRSDADCTDTTAGPVGTRFRCHGAAVDRAGWCLPGSLAVCHTEGDCAASGETCAPGFFFESLDVDGGSLPLVEGRCQTPFRDGGAPVTRCRSSAACRNGLCTELGVCVAMCDARAQDGNAGCPTELPRCTLVAVPTGTTPSQVYLPICAPASCRKPSDCASGLDCSMLLESGGALEGACLRATGTAVQGAGCELTQTAVESSCASAICLPSGASSAGRCSRWCTRDAEIDSADGCGALGLCVGVLAGRAADGGALHADLCMPWQGSGRPCTNGADCAVDGGGAERCEAVSDRGEARGACRTIGSAGTHAVGEACNGDSDCASGICLERPRRPDRAYCSAWCPGADGGAHVDCTGETSCVPVVIDGRGRVDAAADVVRAGLCLRRQTGDACFAYAAGTLPCASNEACTSVGLSGLHCQLAEWSPWRGTCVDGSGRPFSLQRPDDGYCASSDGCTYAGTDFVTGAPTFGCAPRCADNTGCEGDGGVSCELALDGYQRARPTEDGMLMVCR